MPHIISQLEETVAFPYHPQPFGPPMTQEERELADAWDLGADTVELGKS